MHENEIIVFVLGSVVLLFVLVYRRIVRQLPKASWLIAAFSAIWLAWLATNLEHVIWPKFFNFIEHLAYLLNGAALFAWCCWGKFQSPEQYPPRSERARGD